MSSETGEFSWTTLFGVTSISFLLFGAVVRFIKSDDFRIFFIVALISGLLAFANHFGSKIFAGSGRRPRKNTKNIF